MVRLGPAPSPILINVSFSPLLQYWGWNPDPPTCCVNTLPLNYTLAPNPTLKHSDIGINKIHIACVGWEASIFRTFPSHGLLPSPPPTISQAPPADHSYSHSSGCLVGLNGKGGLGVNVFLQIPPCSASGGLHRFWAWGVLVGMSETAPTPPQQA